jgi:hypothetical protein
VVVGAGAVAGAIGAILALVPGPAPPLRANLGDVRVGPQLTLADWAIRAAPGTALAPSGATASRLAAEVMVQAGDETTSVGPTGPSGGPVIQPRRLSEEDTKALNDGLTLALSNPDASLTETDLGSACADDVARPECGLRSTATYLLEAHSPPTPRASRITSSRSLTASAFPRLWGSRSASPSTSNSLRPTSAGTRRQSAGPSTATMAWLPSRRTGSGGIRPHGFGKRRAA